MKRRIVIVFLIAFTLWPLVHRAMVATFNTNPWKFYGWAMFCVPNPETRLEPIGRKDGKVVEMISTQRDRIEALTYNYRRAHLGALAPPAEEVAQAILDRHPELDAFVMIVSQRHLDRETALLKWEHEETIARRQ